MKLRSLHLVPLLLLLACCSIAPASGAGGRWTFLKNVGVSGMHMQLLHNDRVILFDRTNAGRSNLSFPAGVPCRMNPQEKDQALRPPQGDCTAHAVEYNVRDNTFRPLTKIVTDTWCSSGYVDVDGTLVQTGGWEDGYRKVRRMPACTGTDASCDWSERLGDPNVLAANRWYATNQRLPDGNAIVVGGIAQPNYEFLPKTTNPFGPGLFDLPFLRTVNTLYPFVHLNIDGNLFIFATNRAILYNYKTRQVVREYPALGNGEWRTNPEAGSSVLLPLKANPTEAEVLVCGGAPAGANEAATRADPNSRVFLPALRTCGRIKITDPAPAWEIESMPSPRVMGDMIMLPNGEVTILNGAKDGVGGWDAAKTLADGPVIYRHDRPVGTRFEVQNPAGTPRPRMYHSSALLLRDGRVLVGGSNPHQFYELNNNVQFPTDVTVEAFSPDYLDTSNNKRRPTIVDPSPRGAANSVTYGENLTILFGLQELDPAAFSVTLVSPSFTTHTFAQGQRLLHLNVELGKPNGFVQGMGGMQFPLPSGVRQATVTMPATSILAPPGYYMLFLVNGRIPSEGIWVHIS